MRVRKRFNFYDDVRRANMIDPKDPADMSQEEHDYWEEQCLMLETMVCPISGMTKERSIEISRAMAESLKNTDYTYMKLIEA